MKNVSLRQLTIFEALARHLSFSRAAEELHLTQPAVSMQVQNLEAMAGLPLTEQMGKRIRLTAAGEEIAQLARRIGLQLRETEEALLAMKGAQGGRLLIGVVSTAKYFAPTLLAQFKRHHPGVELRLSVNNRDAVVRQLAENEIDIAIMGTPPNELDTVAEVFAEHPLVFICAPDHPLAKKKNISPAMLSREILLIRESGSGTRRALERYLEENKLTPGETMEMGGNETLKQAVMAGLGIAFISEHTIGLELSVKRIKVLDVLGTPVKRQWHLVHRAEKRLLPVASAFREFMRSEAAQLLSTAAKTAPPRRRTVRHADN
jgi:DNA-binding transcriptional LysR family regulator